MKNTLITLSGILALLAVLGKFYATPALAQWRRAPPVINLDERGRAPYMQFQATVCPGGGTVGCRVTFPSVPAGKRLVLERVNASISFAVHGVRATGVLTPENVEFLFGARQISDPDLLIVNESTLAYFESGQAPIFQVVLIDGQDVPVITATLSGYFVDIEQ